MHKIKVNIEHEKSNLSLHGELTLTSTKHINKNLFTPNIMGPFSYLSSMECNHAILAMKNTVNGSLSMNNETYPFHSGIGYIEKDWGTSFPKSYVWCQANQFENSKINFMLSIAHIPFYSFEFQGLICVLQLDNKEFKFTTYHGSKILKYKVTPTKIDIVLKKGIYTLHINSSDNNGLSLAAPVKGKMEKEVFESIDSTLFLTLKKEDQVLFTDSSFHSGLEIVI